MPAAWPLLLRARAEMVDAIERTLAGHRLPPLAWYDVLWALEQAPGRTLRMGMLAEALVVSRSHLSHLVARLEAAKLVARRKSADDRRGAVALLTDRGAALRLSMWPVYREAVAAEFARHLRPADARGLAASLRRLLVSRRRAKVC
ncbi:MAG TPA: MarR family transcriptional regulator [Vineibacter sp.]|nr:MarR family transcriptional regulator [Vineibacter sp.]